MRVLYISPDHLELTANHRPQKIVVAGVVALSLILWVSGASVGALAAIACAAVLSLAAGNSRASLDRPSGKVTIRYDAQVRLFSKHHTVDLSSVTGVALEGDGGRRSLVLLIGPTDTVYLGRMDGSQANAVSLVTKIADWLGQAR